jgi:hypothetical protein
MSLSPGFQVLSLSLKAFSITGIEHITINEKSEYFTYLTDKNSTIIAVLLKGMMNTS